MLDFGKTPIQGPTQSWSSLGYFETVTPSPPLPKLWLAESLLIFVLRLGVLLLLVVVILNKEARKENMNSLSDFKTGLICMIDFQFLSGS